MPSCSVPECDRASIAKGFCSKHYTANRRENEPGFREYQIAKAVEWNKNNPERRKVLDDRRMDKYRQDETYKLRDAVTYKIWLPQVRSIRSTAQRAAVRKR